MADLVKLYDLRSPELPQEFWFLRHIFMTDAIGPGYKKFLEAKEKLKHKQNQLTMDLSCTD